MRFDLHKGVSTGSGRDERCGTYLVDCGHNCRLFQQYLQILHTEIRHSAPERSATNVTQRQRDVPDRSNFPSIKQLLHLAPRLDKSRGLAVRDGFACFGVVRLGPVHELSRQGKKVSVRLEGDCNKGRT